jgi:hypothetical protein
MLIKHEGPVFITPACELVGPEEDAATGVVLNKEKERAGPVRGCPVAVVQSLDQTGMAAEDEQLLEEAGCACCCGRACARQRRGRRTELATDAH